MLHFPGLGEEARSTAVDTGQPPGWGQLERGAVCPRGCHCGGAIAPHVVLVVAERLLRGASLSSRRGVSRRVSASSRMGRGCWACSCLRPCRPGRAVVQGLVIPEGVSRSL